MIDSDDRPYRPNLCRPPCMFAVSDSALATVGEKDVDEMFWTSTSQNDLFDYPGWVRPSFDWADLKRHGKAPRAKPYVMPPVTPPWTPKCTISHQVYVSPSKRFYDQSKEGGKEVRDRMAKSQMPWFDEHPDWSTMQTIAWTTARKNLNDEDLRKSLPPPPKPTYSRSGSRSCSREDIKNALRPPWGICVEKGRPASVAHSIREKPFIEPLRVKTPARIRMPPKELVWHIPTVEKYCVNSILSGLKDIVRRRTPKVKPARERPTE